MKVFTVHVRPARSPLLVREGFSWGALFLGPLWFALHRAWVPAVLAAAALAASLATPPWLRPVLCPAVLLCCGVLGRDGVRWSLDRRGYTLDSVVAAPTGDAAFFRLLTHRADLREDAA